MSDHLHIASLELPFAVIAFAVGYLFGSIPFGLILTRLAGTADIRTVGSGNIGATNVLRTGRKSLAAATLLGDLLKGLAAVVLMGRVAGPDAMLLAGLGAVLGHIFPIWLGFKGGKGVSTYIGVLIAVSWPAALGFCVVWGVTAFVTRYSSLSALLACAATPLVVWYVAGGKPALLFLVLSLIVWATHRANIARLLAGTESKIGAKTATVPPSAT